MQSRKFRILSVPVFLFFLSGPIFPGGQHDGSPEGSPSGSPVGAPVMVVSILPQGYFADRVSGGLVKPLVLVGPGQNPHTYEPSPQQMARLGEAKVWVLSGTEFEITLVPKIRSLFPGLTIVDGTRGVRFRPLDDHGHDDGDAHTADGMDRHTWLGREPAKILAGHVRDALCDMDPANARIYRENCAKLAADIDREFDELTAELAPLRGKPVFVYHPAFGYFLDEFGIIQEAVETGGKEPTPRVLAELIDEARKDQAAAIFVQAQFPVDAAKTVARAVGAEVVPLDDLAPDWLANIRRMGDSLKKAVRGVPGLSGK